MKNYTQFIKKLQRPPDSDKHSYIMYPESKNALSIISGVQTSEVSDVWTLVLLELHSCNAGLWKLEEAVRKKDIGDARVAALKHEIDRCNMRRHAAVAKLDFHLAELFVTFVAEDAGAVLNSETLGQMLDRLSVLMLKRDNFSVKGDNASLDRVERHIRHICACFDNAVELAGRGASLPGCGELKDYGDGGAAS